ncbi:hypothetical protein GCM10023097_74610 [Streptomyces collinus]
MPEPRLNPVGIVVADMAAARAFYARLGLDSKSDKHMPAHASCAPLKGLRAVRINTVVRAANARCKRAALRGVHRARLAEVAVRAYEPLGRVRPRALPAQPVHADQVVPSAQD